MMYWTFDEYRQDRQEIFIWSLPYLPYLPYLLSPTTKMQANAFKLSTGNTWMRPRLCSQEVHTLGIHPLQVSSLPRR